MKRNILKLASFIFGCAVAVSCADDNYMELDKGHDELTLSVNASEFVLDEAEHGADALALTWTTGTNFGTGNKIYYTLEIAEAGTEFAAPYVVVDNQIQTYSFNATVEELNNAVRAFFGESEDTFALEARVTATVPETDELQESVVSFNVTTYKPVTSVLYIFGDGTKTGWSLDAMEEMKRVDNGIFTWTGKLFGGKGFKFAVQRDFIPTYNYASEGKLVYRATYDDPDECFYVEETGNYQVDVNLLDLTISIKTSAAETPLFESLYLIGNMTGWGFEPFTADAIDPFLFRLGKFFDKGGEFKFGTADGSWENNFKAPYANAPYTETKTVFVSGFDPDDKWNLQDSEAGKAYKICFDIRKDRERMLMAEFVPYEMIYLIGSASPAGWDLGNATAMTAGADAYTFTWEGHLKEGELKFTCDRKSDWMGAWFMASEGGKAPSGEIEHMLFIDKSSDWCKNQYLEIGIGDLDYKWNITEAGTYVITLDQLKETVSIVKK
ncbi:MAG: SusF/SusE family outer membrane protein [Bacteroidales bacterium]|nr:SusF/SusE family outer membrane protein [Bacteroidales bacterium]